MRLQKGDVPTTTTTTEKPDKSKLGKVSLTLVDAMTIRTNVNPPSDTWPKKSQVHAGAWLVFSSKATPGNTNWKGRLSMVDLLIKVAYGCQ